MRLVLALTLAVAALPARALEKALPPSIPTAGLFTVETDSLVAEDYGRGRFRITAKADADTDRLGRHWHARLHPAGDPEGAWDGPALWKQFRPRLLKAGWKPVHEEVTDTVDATLTRPGKGGAEWCRLFFTPNDPGTNWIDVVEVAPVPVTLALAPPAPQPEKVADDADFPYFKPFPGSKRVQTSVDDGPMMLTLDGEPTVVAPGSVLKEYEGIPEISNLEFVTVYRAALEQAGWKIIELVEGPEASDTVITARYAKGGRDLWAYVHQNWTGWSVRIGDAGAARLKADLEKKCRVDVYGVRFDFNKATLRPDADPTLQQLLALFQGDPALKAEVSGHTDDVGGRPSNLKLSKARAEAVKAWLVAHGIGADRLTTQGYADTQPVVPNDSDENRAKNRRVVIQKAGCTAK